MHLVRRSLFPLSQGAKQSKAGANFLSTVPKHDFSTVPVDPPGGDAAALRKAEFQKKLEQLRRVRQIVASAPPKSGEKTTSLFRFMNAGEIGDYMSPIERKQGREAYEQKVEELEKVHPGVKQRMIENHGMGDEDYEAPSFGYSHSPFVSTTDNPVGASLTTDVANLGAIVENSPHLARFSVPSRQVISPDLELSKSEGEKLYEGGKDGRLQHHVEEVIPNPWEGGIPRFSRLTPSFIGAMFGGDEEGKQ